MDELTERRLVHNEQLFRDVNERVREAHDDGSGDTIAFICECSDRDCTERVHLTPAEYAEIRSQRDRFVIVPGHEIVEIEQVVKHEGDHDVVEKNRAA